MGQSESSLQVDLQEEPQQDSQKTEDSTVDSNQKGTLAQIYKLGPQETIETFYKFGKVLGVGHFGATKYVVEKSSGKKFACKIIHKNRKNSKHLKAYKREIQIMQHLCGHRNIVKIEAALKDSRRVYIIMELCTGGELFHSIVERGYYPERDAAVVFRNLVQTIEYCHKKGVIHRDLKPENIMFADRSPNADIKLIDFGLALFYTEGKNITDAVGSLYYVAPEVVGKDYSKAADIWSLGVLLYVLLSGCPPFRGETEKETIDMILYADPDFSSPPWPSVSAEAKSLVSALLTRDPTKRPAPADILQHPWLRPYDAMSKTQSSDTSEESLSWWSWRDSRKETAVAAVEGAAVKDSPQSRKSSRRTQVNDSLEDLKWNASKNNNDSPTAQNSTSQQYKRNVTKSPTARTQSNVEEKTSLESAKSDDLLSGLIAKFRASFTGMSDLPTLDEEKEMGEWSMKGGLEGIPPQNGSLEKVGKGYANGGLEDESEGSISGRHRLESRRAAKRHSTEVKQSVRAERKETTRVGVQMQLLTVAEKDEDDASVKDGSQTTDQARPGHAERGSSERPFSWFNLNWLTNASSGLSEEKDSKDGLGTQPASAEQPETLSTRLSAGKKNLSSKEVSGNAAEALNRGAGSAAVATGTVEELPSRGSQGTSARGRNFEDEDGMNLSLRLPPKPLAVSPFEHLIATTTPVETPTHSTDGRARGFVILEGAHSGRLRRAPAFQLDNSDDVPKNSISYVRPSLVDSQNSTSTTEATTEALHAAASKLMFLESSQQLGSFRLTDTPTDSPRQPSSSRSVYVNPFTMPKKTLAPPVSPFLDKIHNFESRRHSGAPVRSQENSSSLFPGSYLSGMASEPHPKSAYITQAEQASHLSRSIPKPPRFPGTAAKEESKLVNSGSFLFDSATRAPLFTDNTRRSTCPPAPSLAQQVSTPSSQQCNSFNEASTTTSKRSSRRQSYEKPTRTSELNQVNSPPLMMVPLTASNLSRKTHNLSQNSLPNCSTPSSSFLHDAGSVLSTDGSHSDASVNGAHYL